MAERKDTNTTYAFGWLLMAFVLFVVGAIFWYYNKYEIMSVARWVRWAELRFVMLFVDNDRVVLSGNGGAPITLARFADMVANTTKTDLTPAMIAVISNVTMKFYLVFISAGMILMALWAMFYGPSTQYRRRYDLGGLLGAQAKTFPYMTPLADFDPTKQPFRAPGAPVPAELPPFAEALSPEEWIAYCGIPTLTDRGIDQNATAKAFSRQLGGSWRGWKAMKPYRQVLLAAFCLRAARKRSESDKMLGDLALCWRQGRLNLDSKLLRQARAILRNEKVSGKVLQRANMHAFETTALLRALATAREEGGVLAPATFIWLRAYDRNLWYPLNNLGRNAFHMEALGAMAHYKAEKLIGRPIVRPKIEGAVQALADYMKSYRARPIPEVDYRGSKRRAIKKVGRAA